MLPISISRNLKMVELPMYNIGFYSYNKVRAPTNFKCEECEVEFNTATAYVSTHKKDT